MIVHIWLVVYARQCEPRFRMGKARSGHREHQPGSDEVRDS